MRLWQRVLGDALDARDEAQALAHRVRAETAALERRARHLPEMPPEEYAARVAAAFGRRHP